MIQAYESKGKGESEQEKSTPEQTPVIVRPNRQLTIKDTVNKEKVYSIEQAAR